MKPRLQAARIQQCGLDFAVVLMDHSLFSETSRLEQTATAAQQLFPGIPVVLMSQDPLKVLRYHGPENVVAFLRQIRPASLAWQEYELG